MHHRRRGTAIVETEEGILVAAGRSGVYLLPGGGAGKHESRMQAAVRELREETGLEAYSTTFLFRFEAKPSFKHGFQDFHTVCLIKARGRARPRHEIRSIAYYDGSPSIRLSHSTQEIIRRYYDYKKYHKEKFEHMRSLSHLAPNDAWTTITTSIKRFFS
jgi:8-oxo-dGTP diphosphatase